MSIHTQRKGDEREGQGRATRLHAKLLSMRDSTAAAFLEVIDAVLALAADDGVITKAQSAALYTDLYNALVVEYEDVPGEGADAPEEGGTHGT